MNYFEVVFVMKLVLLISVCVCIAAVYGRKDHRRTAKEEHQRESRHDMHHKMMMRDENHTKKRMMSDAQRNAKFNTAEEKVKLPVEQLTVDLEVFHSK